MNKQIQVKPALLSLVVLDWIQWGFCYLGALPLIPENAGHLVNVLPFPLFVSPPTA
jgi:hypothetical protein